MKKLIVVFFSVLVISCNSPKTTDQAKQVPQPRVEENGIKIIFPDDPEKLKFFSTEKAKTENIAAQYKAPASVSVSIVQSSERGGRNTVLFDDADLNAFFEDDLARTNRPQLHSSKDRRQLGVRHAAEQAQLGDD